MPTYCEISINGKRFRVLSGLTIKEALKEAGFSYSIFLGEGDVQIPCSLGGCYSCTVMMDGEPVRSCITKIRENAEIQLFLPKDYVPRRIIHGPQPHTVGGKATPWWLKPGKRYIEVAIWTAGCNLRCPQCQNYEITYDNTLPASTPKEAAELVTAARQNYKVNRMAISGGEPTLNRAWLIQYFKELKRLNPDKDARFHLDSNGTILTEDYIDELMDVGITDLGIEPKGLKPETFSRITGIKDINLVKRYLNTAWKAIEYVNAHYKDRVFLGVGLPYNKELIGLEEVSQFGKRLASIDSEIQLCVLDYFPSFKRRDITRPEPQEMLEVKEILERTGLKIVVVQTSIGHFGPEDVGI